MIKKKKFGDYCGLHFNKKNIILCNQELPNKYKKYISFESFQEKEVSIPTKTGVLTLMNTLTFYKLEIPKKIDKVTLILKIENFFNLLKMYNSGKNLKKVKKIQKNLKYYLNNKESILRGPGYLKRCICNNKEDFFTFELLKDIPDKYFFSFKDEDFFVYGFDIRSFKKLIEKNNINPYNRNNIPQNALSNYNKIIKNLNLNLEFNDNETNQKILNKNKIKFETIRVFQKIDELDSYAGGININWFLNLNRRNLKEYYKLLEDIWNYRAELTNEKKKEIILNNTIFKMSVKHFYNLTEKEKMREIILNEINLLVDSSPKRENKILGSYYVLTALVSISHEAAMTLPWLIQG